MSKQKAVVIKKKGKLLLKDKLALRVVNTAAKRNCAITLKLNQKNVDYFKNLALQRKLNPKEWVIVVVSANDKYGQPIAAMLQPNANFQAIRDGGMVPFARGLVDKQDFQEIIEYFDVPAAEKLKKMKGLAVVVVDHGVAEIFPA